MNDLLPPPKDTSLSGLSPAVRTEARLLLTLIEHAKKTKCLQHLDMESDHCRIFKATLEEFGAKHIHMVCRELRVYASTKEDREDYFKCYGLEVRDGRNAVFIGPRGERDRAKSETRSLRREFQSGVLVEPYSTWMDEDLSPERLDQVNPRNYPSCNRLIEEGLSVLQRTSLSATPTAASSRPRPRF